MNRRVHIFFEGGFIVEDTPSIKLSQHSICPTALIEMLEVVKSKVSGGRYICAFKTCL